MIGLGIMGSAMAGHLLRAGYRVTGYDVSSGRLEAHAAAGGIAATDAQDVARQARIVICSLPSSEALVQTAVALARAPRPPRLVIETSTLPLEVKEKARHRLASAGAVLLDCPLSGTGAQARTADLVVYASGDSVAWRRAVPIVRTFSRAQYFVGPFGAGSMLKFVANLLVAIHNVAAAEALVLARQAGLDPAMVLEAVADGAGNSRVLQLRGPMMIARDYSAPTMKLGVWKKDMAIIADFARRVGAATPLFTASAAIYDAALDSGSSQEDTAAVCAVLERMARRSRKVEGRRKKEEVRSRP